MPQCPLCGSDLVDESCPVCSESAPGSDGSTERDAAAVRRPAARATAVEAVAATAPATTPRSAADRRASWYAAAGMEPPAPAAPAQETSSDRLLAVAPRTAAGAEDAGDVPTAILLLATVLGHFISLNFRDYPPNGGNLLLAVLFDALCLVTAGFLFKGSGFARGLVWLAIALGAVSGGLMMLVSIGAGLATLGGVVMLAIVSRGSERWLTFSALVVGAALAVGTPLVKGVGGRSDPMEGLAALALPEGRFSDARTRLQVTAPEGFLLFDPAAVAQGLARKGGGKGLLHLIAGGGAELDIPVGSLGVIALDGNGELTAMVQVKTLPAHLPLDKELEHVDAQTRARTEYARDDDLVPEALRGLEHAGWQGTSGLGSTLIVVARAPDGRTVTALCGSRRSATLFAPRCAALFAGIALPAR